MEVAVQLGRAETSAEKKSADSLYKHWHLFPPVIARSLQKNTQQIPWEFSNALLEKVYSSILFTMTLMCLWFMRFARGSSLSSIWETHYLHTHLNAPVVTIAHLKEQVCVWQVEHITCFFKETLVENWSTFILDRSRSYRLVTKQAKNLIYGQFRFTDKPQIQYV